MLKRLTLKSLRKPENRELVWHSIQAILARSGGALASFVMNIVIARYLGASESGYLFLAITVVTLVATIGRIGADNAVLRFVSVLSENSDWDGINGLMFVMLKWVWIITGLIAVIIAVFARQISIALFHKSELTWSLFWTAWSIPFMAAYNIYGMALQARRKVLLSVTALKIVSPIILIAMALLVATHGSTTMSIYFTASCIITTVLSYWWWHKSVPYGKGTYDFKLLWKTCIPLWLGAIMTQLIIWGGQFVAGIYNNSAELSQLAVARNTAVLISFVMTAINFVSAPRFASLYSQGKMEELKKYARNTTWFLMLAATPIFIVVMAFPGAIMSVFGKDFVSGFWLLRILAIGQYINVITGSTTYLLIMSGHEKDMLAIRTINAIGAVILAFILNPLFGAIGSAIASSIAVAASNFMELSRVKKRLGFSTMDTLGLFK